MLLRLRVRWPGVYVRSEFMSIKILTSEFMELPTEPGTVTVVSGTGAFIAPIAVIQELAGSPGAMQQFVED